MAPEHESAGVVFPDGTRVLAGGLDAHCWPGSEEAFRHELATPSPESWDRSPHARGVGSGGPEADGLLEAIAGLRAELDRHDRLSCSADAAARAAQIECGELRSTTTAPPEAPADWHVEHLRTTGALHRLVRGHR